MDGESSCSFASEDFLLRAAAFKRPPLSSDGELDGLASMECYGRSRSKIIQWKPVLAFLRGILCVSFLAIIVGERISGAQSMLNAPCRRADLHERRKIMRIQAK